MALMQKLSLTRGVVLPKENVKSNKNKLENASENHKQEKCNILRIKKQCKLVVFIGWEISTKDRWCNFEL